MENKFKVTLSAEIDKDELQYLMSLINKNLPEEQWEKLNGKEIYVSPEDFAENEKGIRLSIILYCIINAKIDEEYINYLLSFNKKLKT